MLITTCKTKLLSHQARRLIFAQEGILALTLRLYRQSCTAEPLSNEFFPHPYLYLKRHGYLIFEHVITSTP